MVDYLFYLGTYRSVHALVNSGALSDQEWPEYCSRAEAQLARYKRIYTVTAPDENAEAMAVCAMADALAFFTAAQNGGNGGAVTSAAIGSVSVSYGNNGAVDLSPKAQERELYRCARTYLDIYRGVG